MCFFLCGEMSFHFFVKCTWHAWGWLFKVLWVLPHHEEWCNMWHTGSVRVNVEHCCLTANSSVLTRLDNPFLNRHCLIQQEETFNYFYLTKAQSRKPVLLVDKSSSSVLPLGNIEYSWCCDILVYMYYCYVWHLFLYT